MALKKTDYVRQRGIVKEDFIRAVRINDRDNKLTVVLVLNNKKGAYRLETKWSHGQITEDPVQDKATLQMLTELMIEAQSVGAEWLAKWQNENSEEDPNQLEMGFQDPED